MASPVLLCTDGSDLSLAALAAGLDLFPPDTPVEFLMVHGGPHLSEMFGSGHAGPAVSEEEFHSEKDTAIAEAEAALAGVAESLGRTDSPRTVIGGEAGQAICDYAGEVSARAIVLGSSGRSGLKRAVLGSVSDHVVRNAPVTVVLTPSTAVDQDD